MSDLLLEIGERDGDETARPMHSVVIGTVAALGDRGRPLVDYPGSPAGRPREALTTVALGPADRGAAVVLSFADGDPGRPVILGKLGGGVPAAARPELEVIADGERLELTAEREIVLRCGRASITLTRAGKILLRGAYISSRSSGANKIKGGSIQLN
ncbi:MAG TPA: DUF6484 domain-containing protein [Thermohalobaculum sp.]|nr:DUF6484 domain-containing protein [Thermohalobaculum sp.]